MTDQFPIDNPPERLTPATAPSRAVREREKSAVREALTLVTEQGAERLAEWLTAIEAQDGPKAAFDSYIKLLEFALPKLQRVTVTDPDGNSPSLPVINVSFNAPAPPKDVTNG